MKQGSDKWCYKDYCSCEKVIVCVCVGETDVLGCHGYLVTIMSYLSVSHMFFPFLPLSLYLSLSLCLPLSLFLTLSCTVRMQNVMCLVFAAVCVHTVPCMHVGSVCLCLYVMHLQICPRISVRSICSYPNKSEVVKNGTWSIMVIFFFLLLLHLVWLRGGHLGQICSMYYDCIISSQWISIVHRTWNED